MKPTDILMSEHRVIEQVLDCLEKILEQCTSENKLDTISAKQAIEFFRGFADHCHHGKEEAKCQRTCRPVRRPARTWPTRQLSGEQARTLAVANPALARDGGQKRRRNHGRRREGI
ncbi:MAG: hemerythrin domain-containing protein [Thermoguttaceae bacterium]